MWGKSAVSYSVFVILLTNLILSECTPASPHVHAQQKGKEREEDGAYSPRDKSHFVDGQHRSEFDHEAILGSLKQAEEFDKLDPEEAKRRLKLLLQKIDRNKDNTIEKHELHAWIVRSFKMLSQEEAEDKFEDADDNDDGVVTWEEYIEDSYGIRSDEDNDLSVEDKSEEDKILKDDKVLFEAADSDRDGQLNKAEFEKFANPEEHPDMLPVILKQTLQEKDLNKDGTIDFQEYVGERAKARDKEWLLVEKEKFDEEFDVDDDGKLSEAEILSWVVPSDEEVAEDEVQHLFSSSDDDQDGKLTFDEILEHHEVFVGSEATDYGDHLHNIHKFEDEL